MGHLDISFRGVFSPIVTMFVLIRISVKSYHNLPIDEPQIISYNTIESSNVQDVT